MSSRFGLLPRHHGGPIRDFSGDTYRRYLKARSRGLYGSNALEAQIDLLYSYCQHELARQRPGQTHLMLYRGVNRVADYEVLREGSSDRRVVLLNSLNSFTLDRERADEFGDFILEVQVPLPKVFFTHPHRLLPGVLKGEDEFVVVGGVGFNQLSAFVGRNGRSSASWGHPPSGFNQLSAFVGRNGLKPARRLAQEPFTSQ